MAITPEFEKWYLQQFPDAERAKVQADLDIIKKASNSQVLQTIPSPPSSHKKESRSEPLIVARGSVVLIAIVFLYLTWNWTQIGETIKILLLPIAFVIVFFICLLFAKNLQYFIKSITSLKAILITALPFLFIPALMLHVHSIQEKQFLLSAPTDNIIHVKINCDVDTISIHGSPGNEWHYTHQLNNTEFHPGDILKLNVNSKFRITSTIVESDDSIDDVGKATSSMYEYADNQDYSKAVIISQDMIHVTEQGGRRYAGSYADFKVTYTLTRIIPQNTSFWSILLVSNPKINRAIPIGLIITEVICALLIAYVLVMGCKKNLVEQEILKAEQITKERKQNAERIAQKTALEIARISKQNEKEIAKQTNFAEERAKIFAQVNGKSIREVAGVPFNITFVGNLPRDNNNSEYGSFTVYRSQKGKCYHSKQGCCSASIPIHLFRTRRKYKPCSICKPPQNHVPFWYSKYIQLKHDCQKYMIDLNEDTEM